MTDFGRPEVSDDFPSLSPCPCIEVEVVFEVDVEMDIPRGFGAVSKTITGCKTMLFLEVEVNVGVGLFPVTDELVLLQWLSLSVISTFSSSRDTDSGRIRRFH